MSLAQYQVPAGAVSSTSAWNPGMEQPSMSQPSGFSGSVPAGPGFVGPAQTSDSRGELTGDPCTTLDVFINSDEIITAQWSEGTCECTSAIHNSTKVISYNAEGRASLLNIELTTKDLYNSGDFGVGKSIASSIGCSSPLQYLCDADAVESSLDMNVGHGDSVHASRLLSQFLAHGLQLHQDLKNTTDQVSISKKGKGTKKGKKGKQAGVTLVCPVGFSQLQRAALVAAAEQADLMIKNIFNRAVAVVAGGLYTASRGKGNDTILEALRGKKLDPTVLYINAFSLDGCDTADKIFYEVALVRCEGGEGAQQVGSRLGFERLNTLATRSGVLPVPVAINDGGVTDHIKNVVTSLLVSKSLAPENVSAVVLDGLLVRGQKQGQKQGQLQGGTRRLQEVDIEALGLPASLYTHRANVVDAAQGACILSAAELESSKQYLQLNDGAWKIAYLLPVADGVLEGRAVAIRVQWDQAQADAQAASDKTLQQQGETGATDAPAGAAAVFEVDTRIWKEDSGPIPPRLVDQRLVQTSFRQDFKWKVSAKLDAGARTVTAAVGWPRVQVLQKSAGGTRWQVLKTLTPLLSVAAVEGATGAKGGGEPVESCSLEVRLDAATGGVSATQAKGRTISAACSELWGRLQLAFVLVLPFALIALWYYSGFITKWYVTRQHTAWLLDFYLKNAPEKLKDPQYVARTISKYEGRMFQLWRGLERTYKVKWQPPQSILDSSSGSLLSDEF